MIKSLLARTIIFIGASQSLYAQEAVTETFGVTTTQEASGFAKALLDQLKANPNWNLAYSVAGTSQQLRALEDGFIPFAITHNQEKEQELVSRGHHRREPIFSNDFLLVGPQSDQISCNTIQNCLSMIANKDMPFLSRGDNSGTHIYEMSNWESLAVDPLILQNT